jgi:CRISPR system Cascade subunit CasB
MSHRLSFQPDTQAAKALLAWHAELEPGPRARLRRASTPTDVVFEPKFHELLHHLADLHPELDRADRREALAAVAGLASRVREHVPGRSLAGQLGVPAARKGGAAQPPLSPLRFRRLLTLDRLEDRYLALGRVIRRLDGRVNLLSLADSVLSWNDHTRQQWAYDYYQPSAAAQENEET